MPPQNWDVHTYLSLYPEKYISAQGEKVILTIIELDA